MKKNNVDSNLRSDYEFRLCESSFNKVKDSHFTFMYVRNPWDRLVSYYIYKFKKNYISMYEHTHGQCNVKKEDGEFKSFLCKFLTDDILHEDKHFCIQSSVWEMKEINFIGKFENLQGDFNTICDKIGIPRQKLPHYNKSKHKHYTEYYDDESREIVAEKYAKDIECFGYEFGK